jgi:hypothetical protein
MDFTFKERLKSFCDKYRIKILDSSKRSPVMSVNQFFVSPKSKDIVHTEPRYETEPLITLTIPLSRLQSISDTEAVFYNNMYEVGARRTFEAWMDQQQEEKRLRDKYPGVKSAFEAYSTMLNLCRESPKTFKDLTE